ncbi:MAG TPA: hypothetical protein VFE23_11355 [Usitatibacter sp.]|nr:hypothetical protein [Usitatibacter sp.]
MKRILSRFALSFVAALVMALPVHAQLFRAYAASYGNDSNPCTVAAPCRLLPAALAAVQDGGEIWLLDSANFNSGGAVAINKNVSILSVPGQVGSIVAVGGANAINIGAGLTVALRNVSITSNANSPGADGIDMTTGKLSVQGSTISVPLAAIHASGIGFLSVHDTVIRDSFVGVHVKGGATADVSRSKFFDLQYGVYAEGVVASTVSSAIVKDCQFANVVNGAQAGATTVGAVARLSVHDSSISGGTYGIVAYSSAGGANAVASVGASTISGASTGLLQSGGSAVLQSMGNNWVVNNTNATAGTITPVGGI